MSESKSKAQVFEARLFSTLLLWTAVTLIFLSGNVWAFASMIILLGLAASWEYFCMGRKSDYPVQWRWGLVVSWLYLLLVGAWLALRGETALLELSSLDGMIIAFVVLSTFIFQLNNKLELSRSLGAVATTVVGFLYIAFLFSFVARLMMVGSDGTGGDIPGAWLILWLVAVTKFTDMGAYITGSLVGKHKMIPHVSPGKTWEGFLGALLWAQLAGCGLYALFGTELGALGCWGHVVILGLLLAVLAVAGDLAESIIKRCFGAKDSGRTLPGIGGALDLVDSLCFTAPALFYYTQFVI